MRALIVLPLEGPPMVVLDVLNEAEERRLRYWLRSRPEYLELIERAQELADEERAA